MLLPVFPLDLIPWIILAMLSPDRNAALFSPLFPQDISAWLLADALATNQAPWQFILAFHTAGGIAAAALITDKRRQWKGTAKATRRPRNQRNLRPA